MDIIDAHVHLWTDDPASYPEHAPRPAYMQQRRFEPDEYWALAEPLGVHRAVLIQTEIYGDDMSYAIDVAARDNRFRVIGMIDPASPPSHATVSKHKASGVVGYRLFMRDPDEIAALRSTAVARLLADCASLGLVVAPLATPCAFASIGTICQAHPDLRVVIDHMGLVQPHAPSTALDLAALCALASFPNVRVKLSGFWALGTGAPHDDLLPQMSVIRNAFGAHRLLWGSDDPYQRWRDDYEAGLALVKRRLSLPDSDVRQVLCENASRLYFVA